MITLMKISIIADTILPFMAIIQAARTLVISKVLYRALLTNKSKLEEQGLLFLIAKDKMMVAFVSNMIITLVGFANILLLTWSISRIHAGWAAYSTRWIEFTAVLFHAIMFAIAQLVFSMFRQSRFKLFTKITKNTV